MSEEQGRDQRRQGKIPDPTIRRLIVYFRALCRLEQQERQQTTSMELAEMEGLSPVMVRKDLSFFGTFGSRGQGYDLASLKSHLARILGYDRRWGLVIIGGGSFSEVLFHSQILRENNFVINKIFEKSPDQESFPPTFPPVYPLEELESRIDPARDHIAVIALPPSEVQAVIDRLGSIGMPAALYLASRTVKAPPRMICLNHDIFLTLGMMTYKLVEKGG